MDKTGVNLYYLQEVEQFGFWNNAWDQSQMMKWSQSRRTKHVGPYKYIKRKKMRYVPQVIKEIIRERH